MSKPTVTTICDKCGKKDVRPLRECHKYGDQAIVYASWMPNGWAIHNTQDGDGPETDKLFVLCDSCERKFKLSVREFQP